MKRSASAAELDDGKNGDSQPSAVSGTPEEEDDDLDLEKELERELAEADAEGLEPPETGPSAEVRQPDGGEPPALQEAESREAEDAAAGAEDTSGEATRLERARKNQDKLKKLTSEQLDRYEAFRRSSLNKRNMKRLLQSVANQAPHPNSTIVMCGIAKMFVGELVEEARTLATEQGETGPLQPAHIHGAYQRLRDQGKIPQRTSVRHRRL